MADEKPHLHVEFYTEAVEHPGKSREAGRPIFEDVEMVFVRIVGDPKNTLRAPANSPSVRDRETNEALTYAQRFPEHYRYFKAQEDQQKAAGTPLTEVPWLTAARRAELKALNVLTVEGLAGLDGTMLQRLGMDGRALKNKAQAWMDAAAGSAVEGRLSDQLAMQSTEIEALKAQIAAMASGGTVSPPVVDPEIEPETNSPFHQWQDEDIKNWIKDQTGARPVGNPSHKTLVSRADEINAELAAKKAA